MSAGEERTAVVHGIERHTGEHVCGAPGGVGTDWRDPSTPVTCPDCLAACWLCLHPSGKSPVCDRCGCLAHYPHHMPPPTPRAR